MRKKNYWKEFCLLFIGIFIGVGIERHSPSSLPKKVIIEKNDTIITKDTLYVMKVPLNEKNVLAELKKQKVPHAKIVLAQSKLETGSYTSKVCKTKNNLFGIRKNNKYKSYKTWKESVSDYKKLISNRYKGGSYYDHLIRIKYAEDPDYINKLKELV